ncbi:MAG: HigA family addiction module antitoxin [Treponema sp.]|nr:HigA family addiction module antitoxin [Treponema sp.]
MSSIKSAKGFDPDYAVAPGEVLGEYLEYSGITQAALAARTGLAPKTINEIVKAKASITAETALRFERTLGRPAHFWGNLERRYREDVARLADRMRLERHLPWLERFPVNEMAKLGWIEKSKNPMFLLDALLRFFGVSSPETWETVWKSKLRLADFRKTERNAENPALISAWLRRGEILAKDIPYSAFDKRKFGESLPEIRKLTTVESPEAFVPRLKAVCAAAGVTVVFVDTLPGLGIYGVSPHYGDRYVMQLSSYRKSHDQLWFTFFHEACHILFHPRKELHFGAGHTESQKAREAEADSFARDRLIPPVELRHFLRTSPFPKLDEIARFADRIGTAPGIVVGRLQHDKRLSMKVGHHLKAPFRWDRA